MYKTLNGITSVIGTICNRTFKLWRWGLRPSLPPSLHSHLRNLTSSSLVNLMLCVIPMEAQSSSDWIQICAAFGFLSQVCSVGP